MCDVYFTYRSFEYKAEINKSYVVWNMCDVRSPFT